MNHGKNIPNLCPTCGFSALLVPTLFLCVPLYMRYYALRPHIFTMSPTDMKLLNQVRSTAILSFRNGIKFQAKKICKPDRTLLLDIYTVHMFQESIVSTIWCEGQEREVQSCHSI